MEFKRKKINLNGRKTTEKPLPKWRCRNVPFRAIQIVVRKLEILVLEFENLVRHFRSNAALAPSDCGVCSVVERPFLTGDAIGRTSPFFLEWSQALPFDETGPWSLLPACIIGVS
uniref:Uncharacterized protein n=1 Tax=Romanomermis culicivorax TaxID=13658 RepID=A0A915IGA5_ROMCU